MRLGRLVLTAAGLPCVMFAGPALAEAENGLSEVIVTAQKRAQDLQDVPLAVSVADVRTLKAAGVRDLKDLNLVAPGLLVTSTANEVQTVARIRGIGTIGDNAGLESSVGLVIDGVYRPRVNAGIGDLGELAQVEVLKGPQGTLFGKNTSAGLISVSTQKPTFTPFAELVAGLGNLDAREASITANGPIVEGRLAGRLYLAGRKREGYYQVDRGAGPRTEARGNDRDYWTARGQLLFAPDQGLEVRAIADYTRREEVCCLATTILRGSTADYVNQAAGRLAIAPSADASSLMAYANRSDPAEVTDMGVSLQSDWRAGLPGEGTLTSVTAFRRWRAVMGQDSDWTGADIFHREKDGDFATAYKTFSQELRYAVETDRASVLAGVYFAAETVNQNTSQIFGRDMERYLSLRLSGGASPTYLSDLAGVSPGAIFRPGAGQRDAYEQTSRTSAVFTDATFHLTRRIDLSAGLRYTSEQKRLSARYANLDAGANGCGAVISAGVTSPAVLGAVCSAFNDPGFQGFSSRQKLSDDELTGSVKLAFAISPELRSYASWSRGYKAGGFNLDRARTAIGRPSPSTDFGAETVEAWEAGLKAGLLDGSLRLNAALFHQTFDGFQLSAFNGISSVVSSIPKVVSRGLDLDVLWATPLEGLSLQAGATYAETQYGRFAPPPGVSARLPGTALSGAPRYTSVLTAVYGRPIGAGLVMRSSLNVRYVSAYNTGSDLNPLKIQPQFATLGASLALSPEKGPWEVEVWGANLTDQIYRQVVFDSALQPGSLSAIMSAPRTYGVRLRLRY